jgi:hypothetical protein
LEPFEVGEIGVWERFDRPSYSSAGRFFSGDQIFKAADT